jgi:GcrA cell cycle regulator
MRSPPWPEASTLYLREAWAAGHPVRDIAIALGVTKNAVVGKVHRLRLTSRPSPIRHGGPQSGRRIHRAARRAAGVALANGETVAARAAREAAEKAPMYGESTQPLPASANTIPALPPPPPVVNVPRETQPPERLFHRIVTCVFPIGEPRTLGFRWCADDAKRDSPYCAYHHSICYVRVRDLRADTDAA